MAKNRAAFFLGPFWYLEGQNSRSPNYKDENFHTNIQSENIFNGKTVII